MSRTEGTAAGRPWARAMFTSVGSATLGATILYLWPERQLEVFAAGAARGAGLFTGAAMTHTSDGWLLAFSDRTVAVTTACSGTDFFLMVAALLGWRLGARMKSPVLAGLSAVALALPLAIFVNGLRIVVVTQAHRWVIPRLPEAYGSFAHMLTGAAVFLPALIALNFILEAYGNRTAASSAVSSHA